MKYYIAYGFNQREIMSVVEIEDSRLVADWMYNSICDSDEDKKAYVELYMKDEAFGSVKTLARQQKITGLY